MPAKKPRIVTDKRKALNKVYNRKYDQTVKGRYSKIKRDAKQRSLLFEIKFQEYESLFFNKNCFYCGQENTTGIDRIDNNLGYLLDNCVPCCKTCNYFKNSFTIEEFENKVKQIYNHLIKGK